MTSSSRLLAFAWVVGMAIGFNAAACGAASDDPDGNGGSGGNGGTGGMPSCEGPEDCDDRNDCTDDTCSLATGVCSHTAVQDGVVCERNGSSGSCQDGICELPGACEGINCNDDNPCTIDTCNPIDGSCEHRDAPDGTRCDFGELPGVCLDGRCVDAMLCSGVECDDDDECTEDGCDPRSGACVHQNTSDGTACADDRGTCQDGSCEARFECSEQGIRNAVEVRGGPHTFDCSGPTVLKTEAVIWIGKDVILDGRGDLTLDGNGTHRLFFVREPHVALIDAELWGFTLTGGNGTGVVAGGIGGAILNSGTLTLVDTTVSGNTASQAGGGIFNGGSLTLRNCTVSNNQSFIQGGGIYNTLGGPENGTLLQLIESVVSGNAAANEGGGVFSEGRVLAVDSMVSQNSAPQGGGFYQIGGDVLTLIRTTVSENEANEGGGIFNYQSDLIMRNSTLAANVAQNTGGALYNRTQSTLALSNSTLSDDESNTGSAIHFLESGDAQLINTIVEGECNLPEMVSSGHCIESPGDTCGLTGPNDQTSVTPTELGLGALRDNGGLTMTLLPAAGSVAIDSATCFDLDGEPVASDQRGVSRPQGDQCDVGAVEVE